MNKTYMGLMLEFETSEIKLMDCCDKYFGLSYGKASTRARHQKLPVPCYRGGSQKSEWLIDAVTLSTWLEERKAQASEDYKRINAA